MPLRYRNLAPEMPNLHRTPDPRAKILPKEVVISLSELGEKTALTMS